MKSRIFSLSIVLTLALSASAAAASVSLGPSQDNTLIQATNP